MMQKKKVIDSSDWNTKWTMFVRSVQKEIDPILASMLCETEFIYFDTEKSVVAIHTYKKFIMFQDLFHEQRDRYQEYLDRFFGSRAMLHVSFTREHELKKIVKSSAKSYTPKQVSYNSNIDISDKDKWKLATRLLQHFGGTIREITVKDTNENDA